MRSEIVWKYLADLAEVPGTIWLIETHDTTARLRKRGATREEAEDALMRAKVKFVTRI